jgi:DNA ligase (NAD+)
MIDTNQQIKILREKIIEFNKQYEIGQPIVEDYIYDFYKKKLNILEENLYYKISEQIGSTPVGTKAKHLKKILSLQHDFGKQAFDTFLTRIKKTLEPFPLVAELKIDGVSVVARYENGNLIRVATRGNGTYGEDITHLAKFLDIPHKIYLKETLELRFEAFIEKDILKNPRNAVAGLLLKKEADQNLKYIRFMPHNLYSETKLWSSYMQLREIFQKMHLDLLNEYKLCHNLSEMEEFFDQTASKKNNLPFEIDGIVFKINDYESCDLLGETEYAPRYAFAIKFENSFAISKILNIAFQVGRFGNITPVAEIEETIIEGRKIKRATLNNLDMLKEKQYAAQDIIKIEMAGQVIPMITDIIEKSNQETTMPQLCPSCSSPLENYMCTK